MLSKPEFHRFAQALSKSGAIRFGQFTLKSGISTPYYIDLSQLMSQPTDMLTLVKILSKHLATTMEKTRAHKIAAIELRGALLGVCVAQHLGVPCVVLRKENKSYGMKGRIVGGTLEPKERVVLFDDVITDGASKVDAIKAIEAEEAQIARVFVVVDREQDGRAILRKLGYHLESLVTITQIVNVLDEMGELDSSTVAKIHSFTERFSSE